MSLSSRNFCVAALVSALLALATGCSAGFTSEVLPSTPTHSSIGNIKGNIHGGQQPVVGARVYVMATGTTGYAGAGIAASTSNASTSLLTSAVPAVCGAGNSNPCIDGSGNYYVISDSGGGFNINGDYTCTLGTNVYIYTTGGNPGAGINPAAGFLAALGPCPSNGGNLASTTPFIYVDEVTTIAAAYAFAGFATDAMHVSNSGTALGIQGLNNAFASSNELVNLSNGVACAFTPATVGAACSSTTNTGNSNGVAPQTLMNTLANILAACINTTSVSSTQCSTLYTGTGTSTLLDTASAAIMLAQNPGANVTSLFGLQTSVGSPFIPDLSSAPNDFTVALNFTGGGLNSPDGIAIDGSGNVWAVNYGNNSLSEFNGSTGAAISTSSGYTGGGLNGPDPIAIDGSGNVWVGNYDNDSLSEFNGSTGAAISTSSGYTGGGLSSPYSIAIDGSGNVWIADSGANNISKFNGSTGAAISGSGGYTGGGLRSPNGIATDGSGNVWATDSGNNSISKFDASTGAAISTPSGYTGGGLSGPASIAIDFSGNAWITNPGNNSLSKFNGSTGVAITTSSGYTGGGLNFLIAITIDGAGNVWVTNPGNNSLSEFNGSTGAAMSGSSGYTTGGQIAPYYGIAIDGSGNVWVTNGSSSTISELIGAGAPVVTPLATGVALNKLGARP